MFEHDKPRWLLMRCMKKVNNGREMVFKIAFQFFVEFILTVFMGFLLILMTDFFLLMIITLSDSNYSTHSIKCTFWSLYHSHNRIEFEKRHFLGCKSHLFLWSIKIHLQIWMKKWFSKHCLFAVPFFKKWSILKIVPDRMCMFALSLTFCHWNDALLYLLWCNNSIFSINTCVYVHFVVCLFD